MSKRAAPGGQRRLLVVTFHFPPDGAVGGLRWAGMSKYLARKGWEVHIVTASPQVDPPPPGVTVHYVPRAYTLNDRYNAAVTRLRARRAGAQPASGAPAAPVPAPDVPARPGFVSQLRSAVGSSLIFPDFGRGWILRAARVARALLKSQPFDVVISSGPPHSGHIAAVLASMGRTEPLWVDLRDPWVSYLHEPLERQRGAQRMSPRPLLRLERFVMAHAQRAITNTAQFSEIFRMFYPELPVSFVSNGVDRDRLPAPAAKLPGFSIVYAGTLYFNRNLTPILRALPAMIERNADARAEVKLRIAGSMASTHEAQFWNEVRELGLGDFIDVRGRVSNAEAMDLVNRSHLALVLAQDQPAQIPAKIYECVAMGAPTLVIAESSSAAATEARRIGAMTAEPTDVEGISRILERLWRERASTTPRPVAPIGYETIARQMDALLRSALGEPVSDSVRPSSPVATTSNSDLMA